MASGGNSGIVRTWAALFAALLCLTTLLPVAAGIGAPSSEEAALEDGAVTVTWSPPPPVYKIEQVGCSATDRAMGPIAKAFMEEHPLIEIEHEGGTNAQAYEQWIAGMSDIAQASRAPEASERRWAEDAGLDLVNIVVGAEAVAVIVSPGLNITSLTVDQLRDLYTGAVTSWSQVGGPDRPVELVGTERGTSANALLNSMVLDGRTFANMTEVDDEEIPAEVRKRDGAVGILLSGLLPADDRELVVSISDGGEAFSPLDPADAFSSDYPLARTFSLTTDGNPQGAMATWLAYILDEDKGQRLLTEHGFLALFDDQREESLAQVGEALNETLTYRVYRTYGDTVETFDTSEPRFVDAAPPAGNVTYEIAAVHGGEESKRTAPLSVEVSADGPADNGSKVGEVDLGTLLPLAAFGGIALVGVLVWARKRR